VAPSRHFAPRINYVAFGSRLCEKAKMLSRDRTSYSFGVVLGAHTASPVKLSREADIGFGGSHDRILGAPSTNQDHEHLGGADSPTVRKLPPTSI
jgi:hypothetical protein